MRSTDFAEAQLLAEAEELESKADPKLASQSKGQRPGAWPSLEFSGGVVVVAEAVVDDGAGPPRPRWGVWPNSETGGAVVWP